MEVTCTRPNAPEEISGVKFVRKEDGSVFAANVSPEEAAAFEGIEGYAICEDGTAEAEALAAAVKAEQDAIEAAAAKEAADKKAADKEAATAKRAATAADK